MFLVMASDPDNDAVSITASNLPGGATFSGNMFSWMPKLRDLGDHQVTFTATDSKGAATSETITITVKQALERLLIRGVAFPDEDYAVRGDELMALVNVENDGTVELENVRIKAYFADEGFYALSDEFDLDANYVASKLLIFELPTSLEPGWHTVGFSINNGDVRRVVYREIYVS